MRIAIISGKGGTGKSGIAASLVVLLQKAVAVDCDVDASNLPILFQHNVEKTESFVSASCIEIDSSLCTLCDKCAELCNFHALHEADGMIIVDNLLCEGCGLCEYICPNHAIKLIEKARSSIYKSQFMYGTMIHGHLFPGDDNSGKMIARLRAIADDEMQNKNIQYQILDGPPGIGCPVISTIIGVDVLIIVTEPTGSGISDLKRIYQTAVSFCRNIKVIINKCDINIKQNNALHHFCRHMKLPIIAELPFDIKVVEAQINNETIITYAPDSTCTLELEKVYQQII